jgi:hypothetical protein
MWLSTQDTTGFIRIELKKNLSLISDMRLRELV